MLEGNTFTLTDNAVEHYREHGYDFKGKRFTVVTWIITDDSEYRHSHPLYDSAGGTAYAVKEADLFFYENEVEWGSVVNFAMKAQLLLDLNKLHEEIGTEEPTEQQKNRYSFLMTCVHNWGLKVYQIGNEMKWQEG